MENIVEESANTSEYDELELHLDAVLLTVLEDMGFIFGDNEVNPWKLLAQVLFGEREFSEDELSIVQSALVSLIFETGSDDLDEETLANEFFILCRMLIMSKFQAQVQNARDFLDEESDEDFEEDYYDHDEEEDEDFEDEDFDE